MIIKDCKIENYKSCQKTEFSFINDSDKHCDILIGKNESGKSNILDAINLITDSSKFNYKNDANKKSKREKKDTKLTFSINLKILNELYKNEEKIPDEIHELVKITEASWKIDFSSDGKLKEYLWVYIEDNLKYSEYVFNSVDSKIEKYSKLSKVKITEANVKGVLGDDFEIFTHSHIEAAIESEIEEPLSKLLKKIVLWKHDPSYIKLNEIPLASFSSNTNTSIPLRNIFWLAGIKNIKDRIDLIKDDVMETESLIKELSKESTKFLNTIWPEHKVSLKVRIDNNKCSVLVEDKDDQNSTYSLDERSDGFKQFISLLLSLSAEVKGNKLENNIILIDEPEVHLHPSGIRYLRDELLKISKSNQVIISTHSIFMVDKNRLDRHHKIEKVEGETIVKRIKKSNPYEEEVIYEALGTSVYEIIQPHMLILEGKTDKDLFDKFTYKFKTEFKPINLGTISADGVERVPNFVKFMDGKMVKGFVLVDSDTAGIKIKERIKRENKAFNTKNTFEYNDFLNRTIARTLEDLYPKEVVEYIIQKFYKINLTLDPQKPVLEQIKNWNRKENTKIDTEQLKSYLINFLISDIEKLSKEKAKNKYKKYYNVLLKFHSKIKN